MTMDTSSGKGKWEKIEATVISMVQQPFGSTLTYHVRKVVFSVE